MWRNRITEVTDARQRRAALRASFAVVRFVPVSWRGPGTRPSARASGPIVTGQRRVLYGVPWSAFARATTLVLTAIDCNPLGDGMWDSANPRDER
jgi:ABC-type dipeptide/oligopeptide/nickel transport system permease subunit